MSQEKKKTKWIHSIIYGEIYNSKFRILKLINNFTS